MPARPPPVHLNLRTVPGTPRVLCKLSRGTDSTRPDRHVLMRLLPCCALAALLPAAAVALDNGGSPALQHPGISRNLLSYLAPLCVRAAVHALELTALHWRLSRM